MDVYEEPTDNSGLFGENSEKCFGSSLIGTTYRQECHFIKFIWRVQEALVY